MKKYLELLKSGIIAETWIITPPDLIGLESNVLLALIKNHEKDISNMAGLLDYELTAQDFVDIVSKHYKEKISQRDIAEALMGLEEKKYIEINFKEGTIQLMLESKKYRRS